MSGVGDPFVAHTSRGCACVFWRKAENANAYFSLLERKRRETEEEYVTLSREQGITYNLCHLSSLAKKEQDSAIIASARYYLA